jgi:ubiquinone/menaquinone biosynthesis C-methylase UbiE
VDQVVSSATHLFDEEQLTLRLKQTMAEKDTLARYDEWHQTMSSHEETEILNLPWYKTVISLLPDLSGKKILEVGCGRGVFANYLANQFPDATIVAVDFSSTAIDIARHQYDAQQNLSFRVENAESLSFSEDSFDWYISCETMEHVLRPELMMKEICRVLKPRGQFVVTTENYFNAYALVWLKCWWQNKPFESGCGVQPHENFFLFPQVLSWFRQNGLHIDKTQSNHYQWLVLPGVAPSRLCTLEVRGKFLQWLCKPFGRHFTYRGSV